MARSATVLSTATVVSQALLVLAAPVLTRLYSPESFGQAAVYASLVAIITSFAALGFERAIPLAQNSGDARGLLRISLLSAVAVSLLAGIGLVFFGSALFRSNEGDALLLSSLVPLGVLTLSVFLILASWATRLKRFPSVALGTVSQSGGTTGVGVALGFANLGSVGLVAGQLVGQAVGVGVLTRGSFRPGTQDENHAPRSAMLSIFRRYRRYPLLVAPTNLMNTAGLLLAPILFSVLVSPVVAGLYALANRVLLLPATVVSRAVARVYISEAREANEAERLSTLTAATFGALCRAGVVPVLFIAVFAQPTFSFVFGDEWSQAGDVAAYLAPWTLLVFFVQPLSQTVLVLDRQGTNLLFQGALLVSRVFAIYFGARLGSAAGAVLAFAAVSFVGMAFYLGFILRISKVPIRRWAASLGPELAIAAPVAGMTYIVLKGPLTSSTTLHQGVALVVAATIAIALTAWRTHPIWSGSMRLPVRLRRQKPPPRF